MGHPTSFFPHFLIFLGTTVVILYAQRTPSAIPFPHKEELEYLTSEEEERLIYGGDESVIVKKIRDLPEGLMHPPISADLPVPTMDPPLPSIFRKKKVKKSNRGFPFRIPRVFLKQGAKMLTPLNRKPRTRKGEMPIPSYRSRPSTLVSSDPDQLEVAFKRIEIMASRAGLNMSSMPRRTQMQVLTRLVPKLPTRLSNLVKSAMQGNSDKMYDYLPEPIGDPFVDEVPSYSSSFDDVHHESYMDGFSGESSVPVHQAIKRPIFDASKISIATDDSQEESQFGGYHPSLTTEKYESDDDDRGVPSFDLIPPSELHEDLHDFGSHKYSHDISGRSAPSAPSSSHSNEYGRETLFSRDANNNKENPSYSHKNLESHGTENLPIVMSAGSWNNHHNSNRSDKALRVSSIKNITTNPIRLSLPTKDKFLQMPQFPIKTTAKPIRVSIISKDRIAINRSSSDPLVKVIHIEPVVHDEGKLQQEETIIAAVVEEVKADDDDNEESASNTNDALSEAKKQLTRVKEISKDVIKAEEDKYKLSQLRQRSRTSTTTTSTTSTTTTERSTTRTTTTNPPTRATITTMMNSRPKENGNNSTGLSPDIILKLDNYDESYWNDGANYDDDDAWNNNNDQYDLTDEEIAATVAELKKYEEQSGLDNSLEQEYPWRLTPHPLEYPDHPDHPKDSPEENKPDKEKKIDSSSQSNHSAPIKRPFPEHFRRPGFGGHPRRPPMMRRPPFRRPIHVRRPLPKSPHMRPRPPLRINDVTVSEIPKEFTKECDYFSENLCLVVQDYPVEAISEALEQHPDIASVLVKEPEAERSWVDGVPRTQEHNYNFKHYFGQQRRNDEQLTSHKHRDFAGEGGFLCPSKVAYGQVKKAKSSSTGDWKYVVNYGEHTQTLRLEKCLTPGDTCSYVMPHYRTACTQVHNYHRLLAWDSEKGLHMDVFKIPSCCTCHVQGYYIPQQNALGFSQARRRDLPPRLKFAPPRYPPFPPRGGKRVPPPPPSLLSPVPNNNPPPPPNKQQATIVVTDISSKPNDKTKEHAMSSSAKELKDDLQDLLAQYSALRERIAKKKNENILVSYTTSVSNSTDSLKPKTRESRNPTKLKPLLQLKKLQLLQTMKKMNTTKNGKLKARARAMILARLNRKLKSSRSGRAMRQQLSNRIGTLGGNTNNNASGQGGSNSSGSGIMSMENIKNRIQLLRNRLNKFNERNKKRHHHNSSLEERIRDRIINSSSNNNPNGNKTINQRLRFKDSNRPSKVNYSYHPIMDYFNGKSKSNNS